MRLPEPRRKSQSMSGAEFKEHMEHAAHAGHEGHDEHKGPSKQIGVTMAVLGVLLALCAAMVGQQRTELMKTMVEQSTKWGLYQAETTKYRMSKSDYEMLVASSPKVAEIKKMEANLRSKRAPSGKADDEDTAELKDLIASAMSDLAELVAPDPGEALKLRAVARRYEADMKEAKEDAEAYDLKIEAHQEAAEHYEIGQLAAEIGIVVASVALLLGSRAVWAISLVFGVASAGLAGSTFFHTRSQLVVAEQKIEAAKQNTAKIEKDDEEDADGDGVPDSKQGAGHDGAKHEAAAGSAKPAENAPAKADEKKEPAGGHDKGHH
jgi:hypothetical protein